MRTGRRIVQQRDQAAHDEEDLAVHVGGGVGREIDHPRRDVLRPGVLERGTAAAPPGVCDARLLPRLRAPRRDTVCVMRVAAAGADGVHGDAVLAEVARDDARQPGDAVLRGAVVRLARSCR